MSVRNRSRRSTSAEWNCHMPVYRQLQQFFMHGVSVPSSTVESWQHLPAELFRPLHAALRSEIMQSSYLQVDETGLAVQDRTKHGTTHKGFLWGYHAPVQRLVYFDYHRVRLEKRCAMAFACGMNSPPIFMTAGSRSIIISWRMPFVRSHWVERIISSQVHTTQRRTSRCTVRSSQRAT